MFNNVGGSLKGVATVICWLGIIGSCISGLACIVIGLSMNNYYRNDPGTPLILGGIVLIIGGSVLSWVGSLAAYGFGELVENSNVIRKQLQDLDAGLRRNANNGSERTSTTSFATKSEKPVNQAASAKTTKTVEEKNTPAKSNTASSGSVDEIIQSLGEDVEWIELEQAGEMGQKLFHMGLYKQKMIPAPAGMNSEDARAAGYRNIKYVNGTKQFYRLVRTVPSLSREQFEKVCNMQGGSTN